MAEIYITAPSPRCAEPSNAVDRLDGFDTITIASDPLHAERARSYLWRLRPHLGPRLAAAHYRPLEMPVAKLVAAVLWIGRVLRR